MLTLLLTTQLPTKQLQVTQTSLAQKMKAKLHTMAEALPLFLTWLHTSLI